MQLSVTRTLEVTTDEIIKYARLSALRLGNSGSIGSLGEKELSDYNQLVEWNRSNKSQASRIELAVAWMAEDLLANKSINEKQPVEKTEISKIVLPLVCDPIVIPTVKSLDPSASPVSVPPVGKTDTKETNKSKSGRPCSICGKEKDWIELGYSIACLDCLNIEAKRAKKISKAFDLTIKHDSKEKPQYENLVTAFNLLKKEYEFRKFKIGDAMSILNCDMTLAQKIMRGLNMLNKAERAGQGKFHLEEWKLH